MAGRRSPKTSGPGVSCFGRTWTRLLTALSIAPPPVRSRRLRRGWCSLGGARPMVFTGPCEEPAGQKGRRVDRGAAGWSPQLGCLPTSAGTGPQPLPTPRRPRLHPKPPARFPEDAGHFRGAAASLAGTPDLQGPSRGPRGAKPRRGVDATRGVRARGPARECLGPGVRDADARTKLPAKLT